MSRGHGAVRVGRDPDPTAHVPTRPGWPTRPARALPAYLQIEEELAARIESGELPPGARIEPEREIAAALGVSRMTARAALVRLAQRGLIERRQGRGTFVAAPKLRQDATHLRGFFAESVGQGVFPVSELIDRGELIATRQLATTLGLRLGRRFGHVQGGLLGGWTFERKNLEQPVNDLPGLQPQLILARIDGHLLPAMAFIQVNLTETRSLVPYAGIAAGYEWFILNANDYRTGT